MKPILQGFMLLTLVLGSGLVQAQERPISGLVSDETGIPIPGVTVQEKGTSKGAVTDFDGEFSLSVSDNNNTVLVFSFLGYKSKEVSIGAKTNFNITLEEDSESLDEVVVVGYGTQKEENLVGSVSTANLGNIETRPSADIASSLQGAVPGLNVRSGAGGDPSSTPSINIRGFNSINGGSPLVIIDGIEGDLANINPNDIASVTVLKDAGAAAIYGARGSFGVVLITTKSGKEGEFNVEYSNNFGFTTNTSRTDFVTNPYTYAKWVDEAIGSYHSGCYVCYEDEDWEIAQQVGNGEREPFYEQQPDGTYKFFGNTDFYDILFKDRRAHQINNISVSGGSKKLRGVISGRTYEREKIQNIQDAEMKRYNLQLKLSANPYEWLELTALSRFSSRYDEQYAGTKNG